MRNLTVQKVCLALITALFFVAAPWLTSEILGGNTLPVTIFAGVSVVLLFVYGLRDRCWLIIPFCLSIEGNLNFIPLTFSIQELAIITVFCYLLFRTIFGLDVGWKLGPAWLWVPLAGLIAVVIYHWISSGDIGVRLLGGTGWGGRKYFKVLIACLCIPLLASFPGIREQDLQKVPFIFFLGSFVDIVPDMLTTFVPATAPLVWRVYSGVNLTEFGSTLQGNFSGEGAITRLGALAKLGTALGLVVLCYFPPRSWFRPDRLWTLPVILLGGFFCALSGFRSNVFRYGLSLMAGLFSTMRFKSLIILPLVMAAALAIAFTQGRIFEYPLAIQRGLAFLPGDWEARAVGETEGSSKWRQRMIELFYKEYFGKAPLLGQGYHFDPRFSMEATDVYLAIARRQELAGDEYADVRNFIEMRQPHEGPIHILLVTGVVGMVFFVGYCAAMLIYSFGSVLKTPSSQVTPIQIWAVALLLPEVFGFFIVFGDLTNFLIRVCPIITLLYRFERIKVTSFPEPQMGLEQEAPSSTPELALHPYSQGWHARQPPLS